MFEADGTEVDEDDYFQFLPFNTTLMLLGSGDAWKSQSEGETCLLDVHKVSSQNSRSSLDRLFGDDA